jgi:hypothetical protein
MSETEEKYPQEKYQKEYRKKHKCVWLEKDSHKKLTALAKGGYRTHKGQLKLIIDLAYEDEAYSS